MNLTPFLVGGTYEAGASYVNGKVRLSLGGGAADAIGAQGDVKLALTPNWTQIKNYTVNIENEIIQTFFPLYYVIYDPNGRH